MKNKTEILRNPLRPLIVIFPFGLLAQSGVFGLIYHFSGHATMAWIAYWMMAAGIVGGFLVALSGLKDWPIIVVRARPRCMGVVYGLGNILVLLFFIGSCLRQREAPDMPDALAYLLAFIGMGLALMTAGLGGALIDRLGGGRHADKNAPVGNVVALNSLSHRQANWTSRRLS